MHVGKYPYGVAVDPGTHIVYVTNYNDGTVSVIDGSTHTVTTTVPLSEWPKRRGGGSGHPHRLRRYPGPRKRRERQPPPGSGRVSVIDGSTDMGDIATVPIGKSPGRGGGGGSGHPHRLRPQVRRRHGVGDRRVHAQRHRHRAPRLGGR